MTQSVESGTGQQYFYKISPVNNDVILNNEDWIYYSRFPMKSCTSRLDDKVAVACKYIT